MLINVKVFCELILSFLKSLTRANPKQPDKFAIFLGYLKKEVRKILIFDMCVELLVMVNFI